MTLKGALTWISTGGGGLLIGAALGLLMTVAFEDPLKKLLQGVRRRSRVLRSRRRTPNASGFEFGGATSPFMIVAGDGTEAIKEELVHLVVSDEPIELPAELAAWRSEIAAEEQARKTSGSPHHWNGDCFAVEKLVEERTARDEEVEIFLHLRRTDYYSFLASQHLDRRFRDGTTPRSRYIDPVGHRRAPVFMSLSLGTSVLVITTDNHVLICQRGPDVGSRPLHWGSRPTKGSARGSTRRAVFRLGYTLPPGAGCVRNCPSKIMSIAWLCSASPSTPSVTNGIRCSWRTRTTSAQSNSIAGCSEAARTVGWRSSPGSSPPSLSGPSCSGCMAGGRRGPGLRSPPLPSISLWSTNMDDGELSGWQGTIRSASAGDDRHVSGVTPLPCHGRTGAPHLVVVNTSGGGARR